MANAGYLRTQLERESPELHASLMRSWEIARKEWLPAMPSKNGSFNSLPHLENVERYADALLAQVDGDHAPFCALQLTPCEKYILLAAVLFHDLGRVNDNGGGTHGDISQTMLANEYAHYGIENKHLSNIIGKVCQYHDCKDKQNVPLLDRDIAPYGVIRVEHLAVLLAFCDNLDGAYKRVRPHYLSKNPTNLIEGFRKSTTNIRANVSTMTVVTCVDRDPINLANIVWKDIIFKWNANACVCNPLSGKAKDEKIQARNIINEIHKYPQRFREALSKGVQFVFRKKDDPSKIDNTYYQSKGFFSFPELKQEQAQESVKSLLPSFNPNDADCAIKCDWLCYRKNVNSENLLPYLILLGVAYTDSEQWKTRKSDDDFNLNKFLAIAADVHTNSRNLEDLKNNLSEYGLPFLAWVLEYQDHLFTWDGRETFEASLNRSFLLEMVERMWRLSAGTFGRTPFSYDTLAAKLRVDDTERVKCAVRRISILSRHPHPPQDEEKRPSHPVIHYTAQHWWWQAGDTFNERKVDTGHRFADLHKRISELAEPHYKNPFK